MTTNYERYYGSPKKVAKLLYGKSEKPYDPVHTKFIQWLHSQEDYGIHSTEIMFRRWLQEEAS